MAANEQSVQAHYRSVGLLERILAGLGEAGRDPDAPTPDDLAPADEFHSLGRVATRDLAQLAALEPGTRVLDVGSGLGGPARFLAATCGCDVTGLDLMPEFCAVATEPAQSYLIAPDALRALLGGLGLREQTWRDVSASMLGWQDANRPPAGEPVPPLGMHLVLGERHAKKRANSSRALRDGRIAYVQGVFVKPV